jgi:hypothetical protein
LLAISLKIAKKGEEENMSIIKAMTRSIPKSSPLLLYTPDALGQVRHEGITNPAFPFT